MEASWRVVDDVESYVRQVLAREAGDIPPREVNAYPWQQVPKVDLRCLHVDEEMVNRHDGIALHCRRRDGFIALVTEGTPLLPLIALGFKHHLVDGYARLRALRHLGVKAASVIIQVRPRKPR